jgi:hypothetical protein
MLGIVLFMGFNGFKDSVLAALGAAVAGIMGILIIILGILLFTISLLSLFCALRIIRYSKLDSENFRHKRFKGYFFTVWFSLLSLGLIMASIALEFKKNVFTGNIKFLMIIGICNGIGALLFLINLLLSGKKINNG